MSSDTTGIFIKENSFIPEAYVLCGDTDPHKKHFLTITNDDAHTHYITCPGSNLAVLVIKSGKTETLSLPYSVGNRYSLQSPNFGTMRCVIEVVENISTALTTVKRYFPTKKDKEREHDAVLQNENLDRVSNGHGVVGVGAHPSPVLGTPSPNPSKQDTPLQVLKLHKAHDISPHISANANMPSARTSYVLPKPAPSNAVAALAMHTTRWKQNSADSMSAQGDGNEDRRSVGHSTPNSSPNYSNHSSSPSSPALKGGDGSGSDDEKSYLLAQRKSPGRGAVTHTVGNSSGSRVAGGAINATGDFDGDSFSSSDMEDESAFYDADAYEASPQRRHRIHDYYPDLPVPPTRTSMSLLGVPLANPLHDSLSSLGGKFGRERRKVVRVQVQDFDFMDRSVRVHLGDTLEFGLNSDVPRHAEHVFEGKSLERELCFEGPLLQQGERTTFRFTPLVSGEIFVTCKIYTDCTTTIIVEPAIAEVADSRPSMSLQSQHTTVGTGMLSRSILSPTSKRSQRKKATTPDAADTIRRDEGETPRANKPSPHEKQFIGDDHKVASVSAESLPDASAADIEREKTYPVRREQSSPVGLPICESVLGTSLKFLTAKASSGASGAQNGNATGGYGTDHSISSFYDSDDHVSGSGTDTGTVIEHRNGDASQGNKLVSKELAMKLPAHAHKGAKLYGSFAFPDTSPLCLKSDREQDSLASAVSSSKLAVSSDTGALPSCEIWVSCYRFTPPLVTVTLPAPGNTKNAGVTVRFVAHAGVNKIGSQTSFKLCCEDEDSGHRSFDAEGISSAPSGRPFFDYCFSAPGNYIVSDIVFPFMRCTVQVQAHVQVHPSVALSSGNVSGRANSSPGLVGSFPLSLASTVNSVEHKQDCKTGAETTQLNDEGKESAAQAVSQARKTRNRKKLLKNAYQEKQRLALPQHKGTADETHVQPSGDELVPALTHSPQADVASNVHEQDDGELDDLDEETKREQQRREERARTILISPITRRLHARAVADYLESDSDTDTSKNIGVSDVPLNSVVPNEDLSSAANDLQTKHVAKTDCNNRMQAAQSVSITAEIGGTSGSQAEIVANLDDSFKDSAASAIIPTESAPKQVLVGNVGRKLWADYSDSDDSDSGKGAAAAAVAAVFVPANRIDEGVAVSAGKKLPLNGLPSSSSAARRAGIPIPTRRPPASTHSTGNLYAAPESHSNIRVKPTTPSPSSSPAQVLGPNAASAPGLKHQKARKSLGSDIAGVLSSNLPVPMSLSEVRANQLAHSAGGSRRGAVRNNTKDSGFPQSDLAVQPGRNSLNDVGSRINPSKKARAKQRLDAAEREASSTGPGTGSEREKSTCSEKDKTGTGSEREGGASSERDGNSAALASTKICAETASDKSKRRKSRSRKNSRVGASPSALAQEQPEGWSSEFKGIDALADSNQNEIFGSESHPEESCEQQQEDIDVDSQSPLSPDEEFLWQRWLVMETLIISGQKDTLRSGRLVSIATLHS